MLCVDKREGIENMNMYMIALILGIIIGVFSANPKFLEPYILGFSVALVFTTVGRLLI